MVIHKYHSGEYTLVHNRFFDEYMLSANGEFVKIYLYLLRSSDTGRELSLSGIADTFNHTESDVRRALTYWEKQKLLHVTYTPDGELASIALTDGAPIPASQEESAAADGTASFRRQTASARSARENADGSSAFDGQTLRTRFTEDAADGSSAFDGQAADMTAGASSREEQTRDGAANRLDSYASHAAGFPLRSDSEPARITISADRKKELAEQEDIQQLMYIAQQYLGKKLSSTEVTNILYFYDGLHFSVDLIEYLIEYCVSKGKRSISYIRAVALEWASKQISTVAEAKKDTSLYSRDYYAVLNAFGIKDRGPAQAEAEMMARWFTQYHFSLEVVLEACRRTINRTHAPNFQYADKILESWKNAGVTRLSDIAALDRPAPAAASAPKPQKNRRTAAANKFNNFPQRDYDFEKLEQQLLDC
ncbi:DnaD domain protein [Marvinbryantia formatexigens]|uniref:DnaD domain protein n=1 Tax=Marvinbryantia formatexigens TaxID=168384 RepID=UPI0002DE37E9|nr:DnaD domain protein [Marvinbryantia formatexigens]UWO23511.1 DnaD domain protein [Marvinbryantia formatexigens DSM 14469]SDG55825.1 DnaD and phage-associated domain-containing protein [Marvinbryantia formatexigens]